MIREHHLGALEPSLQLEAMQRHPHRLFEGTAEVPRTGLARLQRDEGRSGDAGALLASVYERFSEGFETADLRVAKVLPDELR
jgi:hypothetical protein